MSIYIAELAHNWLSTPDVSIHNNVFATLHNQTAVTRCSELVISNLTEICQSALCRASSTLL